MLTALVQAPALPADIRLGLYWLRLTKTPAYYGTVLITVKAYIIGTMFFNNSLWPHP